MRDTMQEATVAAAPESLRSLNPTRVWRVTYKGPQDISSLWILYPSETVAFEAMQKMNRALPVRSLYRGAFFIILDSAGVPAQALGDFEEGVVKALP